MSTLGTEAPKDTSRDRRRPARPPGRIQRIWGRLSDGLEARQLWDQFRSEARASYELYRKEVDWDAREKEKGLRRGFRIAREMAWAILMKLSPPRRVFLVLAVLVAVFGAISFVFGRYSLSVDVRTFGSALLFIL